jgi:pimeloyl-ACP methyl ester carboxylesterase
MIPAPGESPGDWWAASGQDDAQRANDVREGRDPDAPFDAVETFLHDLPPEVLAAALERGEPRQAGAPFGQPWPLDAWPDVPARVIAGRHDRLFPLEFMRRHSRERLGVEPDAIDTGHLPALARPDDLTGRLLAYAAEVHPIVRAPRSR